MGPVESTLEGDVTDVQFMTVARLQSSEGAIIGISYAPSMH